MTDSEDDSGNSKKPDQNQFNNKENIEVDHELEKLRLKRMESLLRQQQNSQRASAVPSLQDKIDVILETIMTPDAFRYYKEIQTKDKALYHRILQFILPPDILQQIDVLLTYRAQGMLRANILDLIQIQQLERKILGIGPKITVKKRDGDSTDLNSFLKNNK
ncbi:MAG: hypothetical protein JW776_09750 [Candidatus Lokiarchaeota archaeon]|nr:hypothetical protein [Candidatus Lokiarchaeota archaeon]